MVRRAVWIDADATVISNVSGLMSWVRGVPAALNVPDECSPSAMSVWNPTRPIMLGGKAVRKSEACALHGHSQERNGGPWRHAAETVAARRCHVAALMLTLCYGFARACRIEQIGTVA